MNIYFFSASITNSSDYVIRFFQFLLLASIVLFLLLAIYYLINIGNKYIEKSKNIIINKKLLVYFMVFFLFLIAIIGIYKSRLFIINVLTPFLLAFVLAYILNPFVSYIERKGVKRFLSVLIVYLSVILFFIILSFTLFPKIYSEIKILIEVMPYYAENLYIGIDEFYSRNSYRISFLPSELSDFYDSLNIDLEYIKRIFEGRDVGGTFSNIGRTATSFFSGVVSIILVPIITFYFLKDTYKIKKFIKKLIPKKQEKRIMEIGNDLNDILSNFVRGQLIVASFIGVVTTIALLILRVEFAILVGIIAGFANVVPYLGPIVGIIPAVFFALLDSPMKAFWVIVVFVIIQQIESGIIVPKVIGGSVGIHPPIIMLSLIIGSSLFGIIGFLIAVPSAAIIKVLSIHFYRFIKEL